MESGDFARHIRRMRRAYSARQKTLLAALEGHAALLNAAPDPAGMHVIARLTPELMARMTDREVEARGVKAGVVARALSSYYAEGPRQQGLVLGYAGFEETAIESGVERLAGALT